MRFALAAFTTLTILTSTARAQPSLTPPGEAPAPAAVQVLPPMPARDAPAPAEKSEGTARALAMGSTALGVIAFIAGSESYDRSLLVGGLALTLVGPSMGHIYAGETGHAVKMSLLRTGGFVLFLTGVFSHVVETDAYGGCEYDTPCGSQSSSESGRRKADAAIWVGGLVVVAGTIYDLVDSSRAARRFNEKSRPTVMFAPTMIQSSRGTAPIPAVGLSGSF